MFAYLGGISAVSSEFNYVNLIGLVSGGKRLSWLHLLQLCGTCALIKYYQFPLLYTFNSYNSDENILRFTLLQLTGIVCNEYFSCCFF